MEKLDKKVILAQGAKATSGLLLYKIQKIDDLGFEKSGQNRFFTADKSYQDQ